MRSTLIAIALLALPGAAHAQYKNSAFGFDLGGWLIQKPALPEDAEANPDKRPLRLSNGLRLGGETNFKFDDHWWFTGRINVGLLQFAGEDPFDKEAKEALGTLLGIQGSIGMRYIIVTDRIRPYVQVALSYLRLMSFTSQSGQDCGGGEFAYCGEGTFSTNYMPHPNVGGVHFQAGGEFLFARDMALHVFADLQHWIVFNTTDNNSVVLGLGIIFYT
ncbi:MAG: hypothetical protein HYZ27_07775 [Deltaproteobacteria bacterium]|nr:hypothetical protein [Deltaproteobacteria bacterium]